MFSGIVEELGEVQRISRRGNITLCEIKASSAFIDTKVGDSIAVNGACLTVVKNALSVLSFEILPETSRLATLGFLRIKDRVNLERALKVGERISGHFVTGHVDCAGLIRKKHYVENNLCFQIAVPHDHMKYLLPRGSVAVDGISLTIVKKIAPTFIVYIIPHTLKNTTLGFKGPSDKVNIEFDILAKK